MVKVETLKEDGFVRILRCREDNRIWYQMWLTDLEKGCIDRYFLDMEVKAWWSINLQRWLICLGLLCVSMCGCGHALNTRSQKVVVLKGEHGSVKFNI